MDEAFQSFESRGFKKHHPIVPESSNYGLTLIAICVLVLLIARLKKSKL